MTVVPTALPGLVPLPGAQALPGTTPTPHDPAGADPFLALLAQLVTPAGTPVPTGASTDVAAEAGAELAEEEAPTAAAPVEGEAEPEESSGDPEILALPVLTQLPAFVPATNLTPAAPRPTPAPEQRSTAESEAAAAVAPSASAPAPEAPAPAAPPAPSAQAVPAVAAPIGVAAAAPVDGAAGRDTPAPVAHQVFPEVVRAAITGETPRRVVVRLAPEHLGEVRIVLRTDRSGALEVSLAGGHDARTAMREGAPELRRMLEAAGSHDVKVVFRHLTEPVAAPAAPAPPTTVRTDVPTTTGGLPVDVGAGTAGGTAHGASQEERHGRTTQDARPGATDGIPDQIVETIRPAARRAGGLDVMM
jgi:flagellar hook-length control protein FliK